MNTFFKVVSFVLFVSLITLNGVLLSKLVHAGNEEKFLNQKIKNLCAKEETLRSEFQLKQDYMRKMISDSAVIEHVIREKTGLSKPNEVIFEFDD